MLRSGYLRLTPLHSGCGCGHIASKAPCGLKNAVAPYYSELYSIVAVEVFDGPRIRGYQCGTDGGALVMVSKSAKEIQIVLGFGFLQHVSLVSVSIFFFFFSLSQKEDD